MSGQRPKRFRKVQVLATLDLLDEKDLGKSVAEDQENAFDWESSNSKEELSSEDGIENAPYLFATSDATTLPMTSNSDQSPVSSNPSKVDRKQWKRQQTAELNWHL